MYYLNIIIVKNLLNKTKIEEDIIIAKSNNLSC
jgi:hypothetical protein